MDAPGWPRRFVASRRTAWTISLLFLGIGVGAVFLGTVVDRDEGAVVVGGAVAALSLAWVLALLARPTPTLVLREDALEWCGRRVPYAAVALGPLRSATHDGHDSHAFDLAFFPTDGPPMPPVTIHDEPWPQWREIREGIAERLAATNDEGQAP